MQNSSTTPTGNNSVSPYLVVRDARALLEFVKKAFDAREKEALSTPDGTMMHCEVVIGDSVIMIGTAPPDMEPTNSMIHIYTEDCDAMYKHAILAGAVSVQEPRDQFYGDRNSGVADQFGNYWWIATHIEDVSSEEIADRMAAMQQEQEKSGTDA